MRLTRKQKIAAMMIGAMVALPAMAMSAETGVQLVGLALDEEPDGWWSIKSKLLGIACGVGAVLPDDGLICETAVDWFEGSAQPDYVPLTDGPDVIGVIDDSEPTFGTALVDGPDPIGGAR